MIKTLLDSGSAVLAFFQEGEKKKQTTGGWMNVEVRRGFHSLRPSALQVARTQ